MVEPAYGTECGEVNVTTSGLHRPGFTYFQTSAVGCVQCRAAGRMITPRHQDA